jgi:predicted secreted protein
MKVFDPEKDLVELFKKLVGGKAKRESQKNLKKVLADKFSHAGLEKKLVSNVKVDVPVLNKEVEMPFGFQNGRFNVINPVSFRASDPDSAFRTACKYAVEGRSIYEHQDDEFGDMQLVIVGQFRPKDEQSPTIVRRVFDDNAVKLFKFDEVPKLIDEIRRTGKEIDGLHVAN